MRTSLLHASSYILMLEACSDSKIASLKYAPYSFNLEAFSGKTVYTACNFVLEAFSDTVKVIKSTK